MLEQCVCREKQKSASRFLVQKTPQEISMAKKTPIWNTFSSYNKHLNFLKIQFSRDINLKKLRTEKFWPSMMNYSGTKYSAYHKGLLSFSFRQCKHLKSKPDLLYQHDFYQFSLDLSRQYPFIKAIIIWLIDFRRNRFRFVTNCSQSKTFRLSRMHPNEISESNKYPVIRNNRVIAR